MLTNDQRERILERAKSETMFQISITEGISYATIYRIIKQNGIAFPKAKLLVGMNEELSEKYIAGASIEELAEEYEVSYSTMRKKLKSLNLW